MAPAGPGGAGRAGVIRERLQSRLAKVRRALPISALARSASIVLAVQVATGIARYLVQIIFARRGGTVEFGIYSFAFGWTQLLVVPATLGLTLSVLRFVPQYIHEERWGLLRGLIRRSCEVTVISSVVFSAVAIGVVLALGTGSSQSSLIIGMALIGLVGLVTVLREATRGTHRVVVAYGIGDLLPMVLIVIVAVALPTAGRRSLRRADAAGDSGRIWTGAGRATDRPAPRRTARFCLANAFFL